MRCTVSFYKSFYKNKGKLYTVLQLLPTVACYTFKLAKYQNRTQFVMTLHCSRLRFEVSQKAVFKVPEHVCSSRKPVVPYSTAFLFSPRVFCKRHTGYLAKTFQSRFFSNLLHEHILFCLLFVKKLSHTM